MADNKSSFHPALAVSNIRNHISITLEKELWSTLDATVLSWLYATISIDLLHTIIEPDATAMDAWNRLRDIFQDNKHSRVVTLEAEFSNTKMENFSNGSAYYQCLNSLADQLKKCWSTDVGEPPCPLTCFGSHKCISRCRDINSAE